VAARGDPSRRYPRKEIAMMKRLAVLFSATILLSVLVVFPASAEHPVDITVNGTATLNQFNTLLTISGTYTCDGPFEQEYSGGGGMIYQSQKGGKIVLAGDAGIDGDLTCNGDPQVWTADVQAYVDGVPAVWKKGKVLASFNIQVCDAECHDGSWDQDVRSVKITK
jgi:hypothetical protein